MVTLIDMAMDADEAAEQTGMTVGADETPKYPWGLCITLNDDALEKLGVGELPAVDTEVQIVARGKVSATRANAQQEGESRAMDVQITEMAIANLDAINGANALDKLFPASQPKAS